MQARKAFVLVGPTASGKSAVGQYLAEQMHAAILSADSMLIYCGMDIGTAKPSAAERGNVPYLGVDLIRPDQDFDVWQYLQLVYGQISTLPDNMPVLIVGGSGLYVKALVEGLDCAIAAPVDRERWNTVLAEQGVEGLQAVLRAQNPAILEQLSDPMNPRRLIRAIEQVMQQDGSQGAPLPRTWSQHACAFVFAGLLPENDVLRNRIAVRVHGMYANGLLDEARALCDAYASLSRTAQQAIGYQEAFSVLRGEIGAVDAKARTVVRTNRLAKRQRTWFRHQAHVEWIVPDGRQSIEELAAGVQKIWREYGAVPIREQQAATR
jgi:tRNA dimethylallyltransferase